MSSEPWNILHTYTHTPVCIHTKYFHSILIFFYLNILNIWNLGMRNEVRAPKYYYFPDYYPVVPMLLLFSHPVVSDSLWPHGLQHTRPLCPSPSLEVCPSSCPLHWWCHPAISSSDMLFSFWPQSFPASGTFAMSQLFASDDQNTGVSVLASVLPMNTQDWSPLGWTGWISLLSKGLSGVFSSTTVWRHQFFGVLPSLWSSSHNHVWPLGRP